MDYAYKVTTHGRAVIAACMALEKSFHITRTAFGSGLVPEDANLADVHQLVEYISEGAIADRSHKDGRFHLTIQFANSEHPEVKTFLLSEFIVFVEDPETGQETDLLYGTLGDYRQPVPGFHPSYPPSVFNFPLVLILSDELHVDVSAPAGLVTWDELGQAVGGLSPRQFNITIPAEGWQPGGDFPYCIDVSVEGATADTVPHVSLHPQSLDTASACGLGASVQSMEGALRFYAKAVPSTAMQASGLLFQPGGGVLPGAPAPGIKVRPHSGLCLDESGYLSLDAASSEEVAQLFTGSKAD